MSYFYDYPIIHYYSVPLYRKNTYIHSTINENEVAF